MSVTRGPDGTLRAKCFGCGEGGDVLSLVAQVRGLNVRRDFKAVLVEAAQMGGLYGLVAEIEAGAPVERPPPPPPPAPEPERSYPDLTVVMGFIGACVRVSGDVDVSAHLASRGLDSAAVADDGLAFALPKSAKLPRWATYQGSTWVETGHRLILPVRNASGEIVSVRAWRVTDGDSPKRLPPAGHRASGLVLACPMAQAWLRGTWSPTRLLIAEGEPDFLHAAMWSIKTPTARIGIVSGSWVPAFAQKCAARLDVYVMTDRDKAGDRYAGEITESIRARGCFVHRWTPMEAA
jgi:DNA primase